MGQYFLGLKTKGDSGQAAETGNSSTLGHAMQAVNFSVNGYTEILTGKEIHEEPRATKNKAQDKILRGAFPLYPYFQSCFLLPRTHTGVTHTTAATIEQVQGREEKL